MPNPLAALYSTGDTLKRRLKAFLADPRGAMELGVTRFGEDQNALQNLAANAYPMAGDRTVLNNPQQIGQFRRELADKGAEQAMAGVLFPNKVTGGNMLSQDLKNELIEKYRRSIAEDPYGVYGVRVFGSGQKSDIGTKLARSSNWVDGVPKSTKLPGTAVFELRPRDPEKTIDAALNYSLGQQNMKIGLVRGDELSAHRMPEAYSALIKSPVVQHIYDWPSDLNPLQKAVR